MSDPVTILLVVAALAAAFALVMVAIGVGALVWIAAGLRRQDEEEARVREIEAGRKREGTSCESDN